MNNFKTANAQQAKVTRHYKNIKEKLRKTKAPTGLTKCAAHTTLHQTIFISILLTKCAAHTSQYFHYKIFIHKNA